MRKEDRIAASRQQGGSPQSQEKPQPRPQEQVKAGGSSDQPPKPMRTPGKMPLPQ